jgi:hypothetical protein
MIYEILKDYYGPGGLIDGLYQYTMQSLASQAAAAVAAATALATGLSNLTGVVGTSSSGAVEIGTGNSLDSLTGEKGGKTGGGGGKRRGRKEGGSLLATRRTSVEFGESGAELATFTPLNRIGRDEGKLDVIGSLGGGGSRVEIGVTLSPDLQARIMEETMDNVGEVILRVNGTKV